MVPLFSMFLWDQSLSICICQLSNSFDKVAKHNFTWQKNLAFFCSWLLLFPAYFTAPCHWVECNAELLMLSASSYFKVWCWTTWPSYTRSKRFAWSGKCSIFRFIDEYKIADYLIQLKPKCCQICWWSDMGFIFWTGRFFQHPFNSEWGYFHELLIFLIN
jgi:hypothetical protein